MFNPTAILADKLGEHLAGTYLQYFSHRRPEYADYIGGAARLCLERIGNSNALYHDVEHTIMVVLVGQQILRGRLHASSITPEDWLHFVCTLLVHDIGFVRGVCPGDTDRAVVVDETGRTVAPPRGASDAALAPFHVDRGKIYARARFGPSLMIDEERVCRGIEMTRFPPPEGAFYRETETEAGLVRAADLIGQMADPFYHRKITALYWEFAETGMAAELGLGDAADLADTYPRFFRAQVEPLIQPALGYLSLTTEGKQWIANLDSNLYQVERAASRIGPFRGAGSGPDPGV
jgi:hypothetical protein